MEKEVQLSARQRQVLQAVAAADGVTAGAKRLGLRPSTMKAHMRLIMAKLHVTTWKEAVAEGYRLGFVPDRRQEGRNSETPANDRRAVRDT